MGAASKAPRAGPWLVTGQDTVRTASRKMNGASGAGLAGREPQAGARWTTHPVAAAAAPGLRCGVPVVTDISRCSLNV